jgi:cell division protein FtsZ
MFVLADSENQGAVIKVIGVGGGGGNAVAHMVAAGIEGVDFICLNTDAQALKHSKVKMALQIGCNITKGLGAGADPEVGRQAAMEDRDRIIEMIEGSDMLFITAGMGGGTGTGAAPVVAQVAKELGILTVAVVTKPFGMEGSKRSVSADQGILELSKHVDSLITIPNQKLLTVLGGDVTLLDAFKAANQVLQGAVQGIADLITRPGMINVDFADVRTVMAETGMAMMGSGSARGETRARDAAEAAVSSPLLEDVNLQGAHGLLINVTAGPDLRTSEFSIVGDTVKAYASEDANVVVGCVIDHEMRDDIRVTVVATGIGRPVVQQVQPQPDARRMTAIAGGRTARGGVPTLEDLHVPTYIRNQREHGQRDMGQREMGQREMGMSAPTRRAVGDGLASDDSSMLDIPAFLRRQAD